MNQNQPKTQGHIQTTPTQNAEAAIQDIHEKIDQSNTYHAYEIRDPYGIMDIVASVASRSRL
jgi:hypothetical protein